MGDGFEGACRAHRPRGWAPTRTRSIAQLGTAAQHYELGPIALAVIKRNVDSAATVIVAGMNAHQEVLVEV